MFSVMVARMVFLRFWWLTRRHVDRQERFPSKVCARLFREFMEVRFSVQGTRTAWCYESSCTYELDDTCINPSCSTRYDRQHVVEKVLGEGCIFCFAVLFCDTVCTCVGMYLLCRLAPSIFAEVVHVRMSIMAHWHM